MSVREHIAMVVDPLFGGAFGGRYYCDPDLLSEAA